MVKVLDQREAWLFLALETILPMIFTSSFTSCVSQRRSASVGGIILEIAWTLRFTRDSFNSFSAILFLWMKSAGDSSAWASP